MEYVHEANTFATEIYRLVVMAIKNHMDYKMKSFPLRLENTNMKRRKENVKLKMLKRKF